MNKNQLIHEIGSKLVVDIGNDKKDWAHLVFSGRIERDEPQMNGFAYTRNGEHEPIAPTDFEVLDFLLELRDAMAATEKRQWRACLIRIDRASGAITFEFEYENASRWEITPKNVEERASELSP